MGDALGEAQLAGGGPERNGRFELLYREYAPRVRGLLRQKVADPELVEDLVQETFLRAYRSFDDYDPRRPTWPWLSTIATRAAINAVGKKSYSAESPSEELGDQMRPACQGPFDRYLARERRRGISDALGSLNSRHRRLLLLQALEGWRYEEIADLEGASMPAVKSVLSRARRTFRDAYETVATERGLNVAAWPAIAWIVARLRAARQAATRSALRAREAMHAPGAQEALAPAGLTQIAGGLVALSVAVAGLSAPSTPTDDSGAEGRQRALAFGGASLEDSDAALAPRGDDSAPSADRPSGPSGDAEGGATAPEEIVADLTDPNRGVEDPEQARVTSITFSPAYARDGTVFAAGTARCPAPPCQFVLFRSSDGGATWTRVRAEGLLGDSILIPPGYPQADSRIFAMANYPTQAGLQVSDDGGESFRSVTAEAPFVTGSAAISPAFNADDPRIVIGSEVPSAYRDDLQTVKPGTYTALPGPLNPAFAPQYPEDARLLFGGLRADAGPPHKVPVVHVCRDAPDPQVGEEGSEPVCRTSDVEGLPAHRAPELRLARDFSGSDLLYAFNARGLVRSRDAATTFESLSTPWSGDLREVALADDGAALFAAVAMPEGDGGGLYVSRDAGAGWQRVADPLLAEGALDVALIDGRVLAGLPGGGLACSADDGRTWAERCPTASATR